MECTSHRDGWQQYRILHS